MNLADKFEVFCRNLRMDEKVISNISSRYKNITKQLNIEYWGSDSEVHHSLYFGSYGRGTEIDYHDIDVLFHLQKKTYLKFNKYYGNGQSALLREIKSVIEKEYKSEFGDDGQVIKIKFTDGICFKLIPCFINDNDSYKYPDIKEGGSWKIINPIQEISEIISSDNSWNNNLKRLCRMTRAWKNKWDVPIGGLLIDTLAYNFLKSWDSKYESFDHYNIMTGEFFKYLKNQNKDQFYWLSPGARENVWRNGKFEEIAEKCYNISIEAIELADKKQEEIATQKWSEIFGNKFPT